MKNIILMLVFAVVAMAASAQRGTVYTLPTVAVNGAVTVYFTPITVSGTYQSLSIAAKCTQLGGTTDGYLAVLASNDGTNYFNLNAAQTDLIFGSPNGRLADTTLCTLTMVNAATVNFVIKQPAHKYYKMYATGTAGDTTSVAATYIFK